MISQGDIGDTAYIIESGRLEVLRDEKKMAELAEGRLLWRNRPTQRRPKNRDGPLLNAMRIDGPGPR